MYYHKYFWIRKSKKLIEADGKDNDVKANLECAHFQNNKELNKNFRIYRYNKLKNCSAGIPIRAVQKGRKYKINLAKNAHTMVIGTTGSGKTTTFIDPSIQILSETKDKPSLVITDPKGELYSLHAESLKSKGYNIKILDLRNPYTSVKWNPLENVFLMYNRAMNLGDEIIVNAETNTYIFEGRIYSDKDEVKLATQIKAQELFDNCYEDLHDIISVLCPITNKSEPIWESGARNMILSIALAMLEDSENKELGMTVEKFNFYNIAKIATNNEDDCEQLLEYFRGRNPLSRSASLSKQVLGSADKTRGSYLSTAYDRLNLFSDTSLCCLTSRNEMSFADFAEVPTALFLQIPDEKETRHTLAAMFILQCYKALVAKANSYLSLSLPRPVYFLLDEFGNLPAIHKLEQMITVGRSRNIWLALVIQSYAQLAKVYDEKVADIVKSNCNIHIFIGSTDIKTIEEFSKRCGNYSVITRSMGYSTAKENDINANSSIKERPLVYPSELQQLNKPTDMGNAIVTVFGYPPIKSKFTPSFLIKVFSLKNTIAQLRPTSYFDEEKVFYDIRNRNGKSKKQYRGNKIEAQIIMTQLSEQIERELAEIFSPQECDALVWAVKTKDFDAFNNLIDLAAMRAMQLNHVHLVSTIEKLRRKLETAITNNKII